MLMGIISDTHGSLYWFEKAMDNLKDVDIILHLGDLLYHGPRNPLPRDYSPGKLADRIKNLSNFYLVKGNCDSNVDETVTEKIFEKRISFFMDDIKIIATHGDETSNYENLADIYHDYDVVMFGHFHFPVVEKMGDTLLFSPGSISLPKDNSENSFAIFNTTTKIFEILNFSNKIIKKYSLG
jgi:hypothetical protein